MTTDEGLRQNDVFDQLEKILPEIFTKDPTLEKLRNLLHTMYREQINSGKNPDFARGYVTALNKFAITLANRIFIFDPPGINDETAISIMQSLSPEAGELMRIHLDVNRKAKQITSHTENLWNMEVGKVSGSLQHIK